MWCRNVNAIDRIRTKWNVIHIVRYEELILDPDLALNTLAATLGLTPRNDAAEVPRYTVPDRYGEQLHGNIEKAPLPERIDAWKQQLAPLEIRAFETVAWKTLLREGYLSDSEASRYRRFSESSVTMLSAGATYSPRSTCRIPNSPKNGA